MKPSQAIKAVEWYLDHKQPVFLWGPPGIGKSQIVHAIAARRKIGLIDKRLSQSDPTELKGHPWPDAKKSVMTFFQDDELPTKGEGILFLDELSNAPAAVQAPAYQLILDRRLGKYELPSGWDVVAAGNRSTDRSGTHTLSAALASRFNHIDVVPDVEEWIAHAAAKGIGQMTRSYVRWRSENLFTDKFEVSNSRAFPNPRAWFRADELVRDTALDPTIRMEMLAGIVGPGVATEFEGFVRSESDLPSIDGILKSPKTAKVPNEPATMHAIVMKLQDLTTAKNIATILEYIERLSKEFEVVYMQSVMRANEALMSTSTVTNWLQRNHEYVA